MVDSNKPKVVVERTYQAKVQELWELWTTKEGFESWWGPVGFRAEVRKLDPRVDGILYYDMIADSPEMVAAMREMGRPTSHETNSRFSQFQPYDRLELTNMIDFLPGITPYENKILVEFFPSEDSVRMVVTLDRLHSDEFTQMQKEGFTSQITKLDTRYGV